MASFFLTTLRLSESRYIVASPPLAKKLSWIGNVVSHKLFFLLKASKRLACSFLMRSLPSKFVLTVVLVGKRVQRQFRIVVQVSWLPLMTFPAVIFLIFFRVSSENIYCKSTKKYIRILSKFPYWRKCSAGSIASYNTNRFLTGSKKFTTRTILGNMQRFVFLECQLKNHL